MLLPFSAKLVIRCYFVSRFVQIIYTSIIIKRILDEVDIFYLTRLRRKTETNTDSQSLIKPRHNLGQIVEFVPCRNNVQVCLFRFSFSMNELSQSINSVYRTAKNRRLPSCVAKSNSSSRVYLN